MKQLNSIEHMFFDMEAGDFSLDVSSLHFYDPATAPGGQVSFQQVFDRFNADIDSVSALRQKLHTVPFGVDHPYWVDDAEFDLANHLQHVELAPPGDWSQLMSTVARLFSRDIPRDRPLWFGAIITGINGVQGLPDNCYAMFLKMHHAAIDGASGRALQEAIHDLQPIAASEKDRAKKRRARAVPSTAKAPSAVSLLAKAYPNNLRKMFTATSSAAQAVPQIVREANKSHQQPQPETEAAKLPETLFNPKQAGPGLKIDGCMFPLADVKAIRQLVPGATLNDVVFAIIAGAMRSYLENHKDLPDVPLTAGMPMDVRDEADQDATVMVTIMMSQLFTDIEDPIERLQQTHSSNKTGKDSTAIRLARPIMRVLENIPHLAVSPLLRSAAWLANRSNMLAMHTLITNVPGIPVPIYLAGGRMVALMGIVPIAGRTALTHAVFSTPDTISITISCNTAVMRNTEEYVQCLRDAFQQYQELL